MPLEISQNFALIVVGAFVFGWLLASVSARLSSRRRSPERDPRDEQIRSLEAEFRVAQTEVARLKSEAEETQQSFEDTTLNLEAKTSVIEGQQAEIDRLSNNLKSSVLKTRELREELADRATQNVHAEAKIREVETELSIAKASAHMMATGVFDEGDTSESDMKPDGSPSPMSKASG